MSDFYELSAAEFEHQVALMRARRAAYLDGVIEERMEHAATMGISTRRRLEADQQRRDERSGLSLYRNLVNGGMTHEEAVRHIHSLGLP